MSDMLCRANEPSRFALETVGLENPGLRRPSATPGFQLHRTHQEEKGGENEVTS